MTQEQLNSTVYFIDPKTNTIDSSSYRNFLDNFKDLTTTPRGVAPRIHIRDERELWSWGIGGNHPYKLSEYSNEEEAELALYETFECDLFKNDQDDTFYSLSMEEAENELKERLSNQE